MPNIDNLIDTIQQNLNINAPLETAYFSTLDLEYAYSQVELDAGTYGIATLTKLSAEVQAHIVSLLDYMG